MHPLFSSYTGLQCGRSTRTSPSPSSSPSSSRCSSSSTTGLCTTSWPAPLLSSAEEPDSDCQPVAGGPRLADKWDSNCTLTVDAFRFRPRTLGNPVGAGFYFIFFNFSLNWGRKALTRPSEVLWILIFAKNTSGAFLCISAVVIICFCVFFPSQLVSCLSEG